MADSIPPPATPPIASVALDGAASAEGLHGRAFRGTLLSLLNETLKAVVGLGGPFVLTHFLGAPEFGVMGTASSILAFAMLLRDGGLCNALVQRRETNPRDANTVFWASIVMGAVVCGLLVLFARATADFFEDPVLQPLLCWMVVPVFIQAASGVPDALFRKHIQFGKMFISETGSFTVATIAAIIAATFHVGVWSFAIRLLGTPALMGLSIALLAGWRPKLTFHFEALRSFANFGAFYFLTAFVGFASLQLDVPIVHKLIGKEQAGIFFLARGLALNTVRQMVAAVSRVMFPVFSLIQHDQSNMRSAFLTGTRCLALLVFPAMAALMVIAPELFRVFLDEEFAPGIRLVQIMALQIAPLCLNNPAAQVLYARGRTRLQFGYSVVISSLEIAAMIVGCRYGIIGVAVLWTAVRIIASPFVLWLASREVDLRLTAALSNASRPLAAAILAGASAWGAAELSRRAGVESSVAILMIKLFTGGAAYSAAALVLERETVSRLLTLLGLSGHMPAFLQPRGARK